MKLNEEKRVACSSASSASRCSFSWSCDTSLSVLLRVPSVIPYWEPIGFRVYVIGLDIDVTAQKVNAFFIEKRLLVYYLVFFLFELSHAPYHGFFSILLLDKGHSGFVIGSLIALAVVCEIIAFGKASVLLNRFTTDKLLMICALAASLRWTITELFTSSIFLIIVSQLLHAFTFAIVHVCAMKVLSENSDELIIAKRQTTCTVITMGLGAALGSYLSGQLWDLSGAGINSFVSVGTLSGVIIIVLLAVKGAVDYKSRSVSSTLTK